MTALLRHPTRVPRLFGEPASPNERTPASKARAPRWEAWPSALERDITGAVRSGMVPRGQILAAVSVLMLLYAVPFLRIADALLDAALPR